MRMRGGIKRNLLNAPSQILSTMFYTSIRNRMQVQKMFVEMVTLGGVVVLIADNNL
jgi:hypothetical protein